MRVVTPVGIKGIQVEQDPMAVRVEQSSEVVLKIVSRMVGRLFEKFVMIWLTWAGTNTSRGGV